MEQVKTILLTILILCLLFVVTAKDMPPILTDQKTEITDSSPDSDDPKARAMMDSIYQRYDEFKSLKVDMVLSTGYQNNIATDTIRGFMDGQKYRLEMPHQDVVHDGKKVWFYDKQSKKVFSKPNNPNEANFISPINTIKGWENTFNYSIAGELDKGGHTFVNMSFTPKTDKYSNALGAPQINIFIDKENFQILKIVFLQPNGYVHMLDYLDLEANIKFEPSLFVLDIS